MGAGDAGGSEVGVVLANVGDKEKMTAGREGTQAHRS